MWHVAGNSWELTTSIIAGGQQSGLTSETAYALKQGANSSLIWGGLPAQSRPGALAAVPGLASVSTWGSAQGIGQIYSNRSEPNERAYHRGGGWSYGTATGVLAINIGAPASGGYGDVGFHAIQ